MIYFCAVCGHQHNDDVEMTPFDQLPDDWRCPKCNADKSAFKGISTSYLDDDG